MSFPSKALPLILIVAIAVIGVSALFFTGVLDNTRDVGDHDSNYSGMYIDILDADRLYSVSYASGTEGITGQEVRDMILKSSYGDEWKKINIYQTRTASGGYQDPIGYDCSMIYAHKVGSDYVVTISNYGKAHQSWDDYLDWFFRNVQPNPDFPFYYCPSSFTNYLVDGKTGEMFYVPSTMTLMVKDDKWDHSWAESLNGGILKANAEKLYIYINSTGTTPSSDYAGCYTFWLENGKVSYEKLMPESSLFISGISDDGIVLISDNMARLPNGELINSEKPLSIVNGHVCTDVIFKNGFLYSSQVMNVGGDFHQKLYDGAEAVHYASADVIYTSLVTKGIGMDNVLYAYDDYIGHQKISKFEIKDALSFTETVLLDELDEIMVLDSLFIVKKDGAAMVFDTKDESLFTIAEGCIQIRLSNLKSFIEIEYVDASLKSVMKYVSFTGEITDSEPIPFVEAVFDINSGKMFGPLHY